MIFIIIILIVLLIISNIYLIYEFRKDDDYESKLRDTKTEIEHLQEKLDIQKELADSYRAKYHEVDRYANAQQDVASTLQQHLYTIYSPDKYVVKYGMESIGVTACTKNHKIVIKSYKFNPENDLDRIYATNIAEEVVDKLNENLKK